MPLQHLRSSTANKRPIPSGMSDGQLAVNSNLASPGLFFKDSNGDLVKAGPVHVGATAPNATPAVSGQTGNSKGEQWLDTSGGRYVFRIWDGTAWRTEDGEFVNASGDTMTGALGIIAGTAAVPALSFSGDTNTGIYSPGADQLAVTISGVQRLTASTTAVTSTLPVVYPLGAVGTPSITFTGDLNTGFWSPSADALAASTAGSERLRITSSGLVGIGTSSPGTKLEVFNTGTYGTAFQPSVYITNSSSGGTVSANTGLGAITWATDSNATLVSSIEAIRENPGAGVSSALAFRTGSSGGGTERVRITSAGNVGIGTTSPAAPLHVAGEIRSGVVGTNGAIILNRASDGLPVNSITFDSGTDEMRLNNGSGGGSIVFQTVSTSRVRIDSSGRLLVGTSTATNNLRLNEIVAIVSAGPDNIAGLSVTTYAGTSLDGGSIIDLQRSRGTTDGSLTKVVADDRLGAIVFRGSDGAAFSDAALIEARVDGEWNTAGDTTDSPGRLVFSTTADGASSPTERMRITNDGVVLVGTTSTATGGSGGNFAFIAQCFTNEENRPIAAFRRNDLITAQIFGSNGGDGNAASCSMRIRSNNGTGRSINAGGTVNASGADYAEYMVKAGDFTIAKGAVCGVNEVGLLTSNYADAVSFVVKSTNPSYVGGDTWGGEDVVGPKPDAEDSEALAQWQADLEAARQKVDRIAFAGQVPVNVMGATPGQYIVPVEAADGGIEGVAKNKSDMTAAEYMDAVGKVIAIEDDGRARIIVKVA